MKINFIVVADCKLVNGAKQSMIYDLTRSKYYSIPHSLYFILKKYNDLDRIKEIYNDPESHKTINDYFDYLLKNEIITWLPQKFLKNFSPLKTEFYYPSLISNAIIDIKQFDSYYVINAIQKLESIGCRFFQLRFLADANWADIKSIIESIEGSTINSIEFMLKYDKQFNFDGVNTVCKTNKRVKSFIFYNSPYNELNNFQNCISHGNLAFTKQNCINDFAHENNCLSYMNSNINLFCESQTKHSYFNKKIAINEVGDIKNSPEDSRIFGNIDHDNLIDIVNKNEFQILWSVKKDVTLVCKDCEFRYMCIDSRIPILSDNKTSWFHNNECNYNPYIAKWKGEEGYRTLKECGIFINSSSIRIDRKILIQINKDMQNS